MDTMIERLSRIISKTHFLREGVWIAEKQKKKRSSEGFGHETINQVQEKNQFKESAAGSFLRN